MDRSGLWALLLATAAGMSTMIGAVIIFLTKTKSEKLISGAMGFAAGMMITVSLIELYPTARADLSTGSSEFWGTILSVLFLMAGVLFAKLLDKLVPHAEYDPALGESPHKNMLRVGMVSAIAILIHNFPEGIATFAAGYQDLNMGISIAVAIAMHNIPEGISVALPIYYGTNSRKKALWFTFLSGVAEPIGALLAWLLLAPILSDFLMGVLFAVVAGIMLYISFEELVPSSRQYGYNSVALWSLFAGVCIMPISLAI